MPEMNYTKQDKEAQKMKKAANAPKGRGKQPQGSAKHNTKPMQAKKMKKGETGKMDKEMYF